MRVAPEDTVDFGEHLTGYLSFRALPAGSVADSPLRLRLTFGEVPTDVAEPLHPYTGWISAAWLPEETVTVDDLPTQAEFICTRVLASREAGVPLKRQAVLFRTGTHSDVLEIELSKRKIPFVKYGGLKFLEAAHVKDLLAVLRWADNPHNQLAAFRVLQFMPGMGPANAKRALEHFVANNYLWTSFEKYEPPNDARLAWKKFVELFAALGDPTREWREKWRNAKSDE